MADRGNRKQPGSGAAADEVEDDVAAQAAEQALGPNPFIGLRATDILATVGEIATQAFTAPALLLKQQAALVGDIVSILAGNTTIVPERGDKRFGDPAWADNPFYRIYLQTYLAWTKALGGFVDNSALDRLAKQRARFVISLFTDALAPTNTLLGNPAALKKAIDSGGGSLRGGLKNLLTDFAENHGMPAQVDMNAFQVGKNLVLSPGAVVFRNEVLEIIQYAPATPEVYARPQVIIPPQINKYYIFDLAPGKSIVEYLVQNGFQVFMVSWRNPTPAQSNWDMDTYVAALLEAINAVREITGAENVNLHGACSGGITLAALLGYLAAKREKMVNAVTMMVMVAVLDSDTDSVLALFATPATIDAAKLNSRRKGVLEGEEMARVFSWMRPNDLVWNYWVNNYLLGNSPPAFDILYWNNDTTRLPARFHAQLLDIFADRLLQQRGSVRILGAPIDLSKVDCDKYVLSGITDHITPWKGVFGTARLFGGATEFVLSSSGHIQSLVNPPGNPKAKFFRGSELTSDPDDWLAAAEQVPGSWWEHWRKWIATRSGEMRPAPTGLGSERHKPGVRAPGRYVFDK
ncbi:MAG: alpha/beta fold hydrolase [Acetobacteraceae bacterium]|nr:alpha/beta fold hydrolase [Acetobacteraceae bacterium]